METRIERDDTGRECLVRRGIGIVTSIVPVGIIDPTGQATAHRVAITCEVPTGRAGSIRFTAHPIVDAGDPLLDVAVDAQRSGIEVEWTARWERHAWIEPDVPISMLNLVTDAHSSLLQIGPLLGHTDLDVHIPDFIPDSWLEGSA